MKKSTLGFVISTALGVSSALTAPVASAGVIDMSWTGYFTLLDWGGSAIANTSLSSKTNQYVTPISGTLQVDNVTGGGVGTIATFDFFGAPLEETSFNLQFIGDGQGGPGTLVLGNMLFSWSGTNGIPVSLIWDAAGLMFGEYATGGLNSAIPAIDGTYVGSVYGDYEDANGHLALGSMPMVTTAWNTTLAANCAVNACLNDPDSGTLPMIYDAAPNQAYDDVNTGGTIGGSPLADGPFTGGNPNFNFANVTLNSYDPNGRIEAYCDLATRLCGNYKVSAVPVPATAWLLGSGLLGLISVARSRKL